MRIHLFLAAFAFFAANAGAAPPSARPVEGLRDRTPAFHALTGARVVVGPGQVIESGTVVLRDGVIASVSPGGEVPDGARVWDLSGKTIYPGFVDAWSQVAVDLKEPQSTAPHWNRQIRPQLRMANRFEPDEGTNKKLRSQGITTRLIVPGGGVIQGQSTLVTTGGDSAAAAIVRPDVAQHLRLTVSRGGDRASYPNSPMGAVALARQAMYDASWFGRATKAYRADPTVAQPESNDALAALHRQVEAQQPFIIEAQNELYFLRADRFAREFGLKIVVRGSGYEYRRLEAIRDTGRAVVVPVNFPKPPNVATPENAMNVSLESMLHWDMAPENPGRLDQAGVSIALTTHGLTDPAKFLEQIRTAVRRGLDADAALRALTTTPAELLAASRDLGTVAQGKMANLVIADGDLFRDKQAAVESVWVAGKRYPITESPVYDLRGTWSVKWSKGKQDAVQVELSGEPGKLKGSLAVRKGKAKVELKGPALHDARFSCSFDSQRFMKEGIARLSAVVSSATSWTGFVLWPDGSRSDFKAARTKAADAADGAGESKTEEAKSGSQQPSPQKSSYAVNYPLGAFGRSSLPEQPECVLFRGATVWTAGRRGTLAKASVLVRNGKIAAVAETIEDLPQGCRVVDAAGQHITPGIIDCHSHMATDGGINESTQAITAEVRIGDFVDADDIAIYRQLAGGVTAANILHGSANPIGGQNQVIKLRWGHLPEEMKFAEAPQGIKFALGENVKQSNWGDKYTTRYPQSRMGVEQIFRDAFRAAQQYQRDHESWQRTRRGLPPRHDLELEALSEILHGRRWIHCHSYRQDEILALIRVLDDFDITIGTFQHILEGYKVADAMAKHGAMGSAFSDWWAYKIEVFDAIPFNGALMHNAGVVVSFNSDDRELARHLNQEAAKAMKYGGVPADEAIKFVTLNAARQLRIDQHVGSIEPGKQADVVVWSGSPLSNRSRCEQTWIDGRKYFDRQDDAAMRERQREMRTVLIQKILASGQAMRSPGEGDGDDSSLWPREDIFCGHHDHGHVHVHHHK